MKESLLRVCRFAISSSFYILIFLVPLLLFPKTYELFEYNKMMATYALTAVIAAAWMVKMVLEKKISIKKSPLDVPILLFLLSQIISTFLSIDRHVSIWGYYSRFNGGLLSTISYIILYYAFLTNFTKEKIKKFLIIALSSGLIVALYGIAEHFGIDKTIWVQDVQNRVFSTLGQPNWLGAYLAILIPITVALLLNSQRSGREDAIHLNTLGYGILSLIFYLTLIFTQSRSGFVGFWIVFALFSLAIFLKNKKVFGKIFIILILVFLTLNFLFGFTFSQLAKYTFTGLRKQHNTVDKVNKAPAASSDSLLDVGITESGTIRKIVWKGAIDITRHYPLFGSGVETFAFSYYQFRPVEHNMTSEWDFLYNKAHNEYLNYAATTGLVGLGIYLLFIFTFSLWSLIKIIKSDYQTNNSEYNDENFHSTYYFLLTTSLFSAWLSITITNFLGFSVVIIQIFFFLIPAILILLNESQPKLRTLNFSRDKSQTETPRINPPQMLLTAAIALTSLYIIYTLIRMWFGDIAYAAGYQKNRTQDYLGAYQNLKTAISLNRSEVLYYDEISLTYAELAVAAREEKDEALTIQLTNDAVAASSFAVMVSSNNVNFWKTRTRVFYALSALDPKYNIEAIEALANAAKLSPTDPKIVYNLGLLYGKIGQPNEAQIALKRATDLKPDYRDAHFALGLFYKSQKETDLARYEFEFILKKIAPTDIESKKQLEELK